MPDIKYTLTEEDRRLIISDLKKGLSATRIAFNRDIYLGLVCGVRNEALDKGELTINDLWTKGSDKDEKPAP